MPLQKLQFRPGLNREGTTLSNEGGWFDGDKIRFRSGYPEKIGGWKLDTGDEYPTSPIGTFVAGGTTTALQPSPYLGTPASFWGVCRSLFNWITLAGNNLVALGTSLKYYIQDSVNGYFYDVTPIRQTTSVGANAFTTTYPGTPTVVTCNVPAHGAQTGDFVVISNVNTAVNGIPLGSLNLEFQIANVLSNNTFTIVVGSGATSAGTTGAATFTFQINTGGATYTTSSGWGAGGWGGTLGAAHSTTLNGAISSSATTIVVVSTTGFTSPTGTIGIGSEVITYTGTTGTSFTGCTRGYTSTAAAHSSGDAVNQYVGATGWGSSSASGTVPTQLRLWSQSNFGQDLIFNPRGSAMYYWAVNSVNTIYDRGQLISPGGTVSVRGSTITCDATTPSAVNRVLVSDASRYVIAFGCNPIDSAGTGIESYLDPMQIRWSNQEEFNTWLPQATNTAGGYRLSTGSQIITAIQTRQEILVLTDSAIYSMQFLGAPYVWGFQIMGDNISVMGPNAAVTVNNITYWMGTDKFYMYSGRVETLPCALRQYVYDDINLDQNYQIFSGTNEGYNEVWWYYCSISGPDGTGTTANPNTTVDRYVIYNHLERTWYYGKLARTAWADSPLRNFPMAAGYNGQLIYHENGVDDGTTTPASPIVSYVQSSDFDIGDGHNFGFVWRLIPDLTFDGSTSAAPKVNFTVLPRQNPGANYGSTDNPSVTSVNNYSSRRNYLIQQFTQQVYVRIRGRQMAFQVGSSDLGVQWQLGSPRIDVTADGRR
jgi:hypothetical protein